MTLPKNNAPILGKYLLVILLFTVNSYAHANVSWQSITPNVIFLKQPNALRFYDANQVLVQGSKCALLVDASGNFAAVEQLANDLKKHLKTPLCYLVATHFHDDHLLGMAVLQHFFPHAKLIVHQQVANDFARYQYALNNKLQGYEKSIELSYQRVMTLSKEEQLLWQERLTRAKQRLLRWQTYELNPPAIAIKTATKLELGSYKVTLTAHQAHTHADLALIVDNGQTLIGGDIIDWLPYPGHGQFPHWQILLKSYINNPALTRFIPGHGNILNKADLQQPLAFLTAITEHVKNNPELALEQLVQSFPLEIMKPYQQTPLDKQSSSLFLQSGLLQAQKSASP